MRNTCWERLIEENNLSTNFCMVGLFIKTKKSDAREANMFI